MLAPFLLVLSQAAEAPATAAPLTANQIMAKLAANQKKMEDLRKGVVYQQEILARMHRGKNKLAREHDYVYNVLPKPDSFERELLSFQGKYEKDGKYITYDNPDYSYKDIDIDGELLDELVQDWTSDKESKDGVSKDLFPLTSEKIRQFEFTLLGTENYDGRDVYRIKFQPKKREKGEDWEIEDRWFGGEALVDKAEFQPVLITTHQSKKIPAAVKLLLGTDIRNTGFKATYKNFGDGLWFPERYGGEFEFRVLFGYARKVSLSMKNSGLRRTNVASSVKYGDEVVKPW